MSHRVIRLQNQGAVLSNGYFTARHSTPVEMHEQENQVDVQQPATRASQTGHKAPEPAKKDAEAEDADQQADEEMMSHSDWLLTVVGIVIAGIGLDWLFGPSIAWMGKLPGDIVTEPVSGVANDCPRDRP